MDDAYPLTKETISSLDTTLQTEEKSLAEEWFAYNGGQLKAERDSSKKPLFFDIALNYAQLDMDQLQRRAGVKAKETKIAEPKASVPTAKAKMEEIVRPETPELPKQQPGGGLSSLLGGWWGRR